MALASMRFVGHTWRGMALNLDKSGKAEAEVLAKDGKTTLVLLSYNEREALEILFPLIPLQIFDRIIAVDGGSTDGTLEFYRERGIELHTQGERNGRGNAFILAQKLVQTENVIFFSTDGNENPQDLPRMVDYLSSGHDLVIAGRFLLKDSQSDSSDDPLRIRKSGGILFGLFARIFWHSGVRDAINGLRGFKVGAMKTLKLDAQGHDIELQSTIRAAKLKMKIKEFSTVELRRLAGRRKPTAATWKLAWSLGRTLVRELLTGKRFQRDPGVGAAHRYKTILRKNGPILLLLLVFGGLYASTLGSYGMFMWDEAEYATLARSLVRGEGYSISLMPNLLRPPMLPLSSAMSMYLSGRIDDVTAKIPVLIYSLLALYSLYWCVAKEYGPAEGLIGAGSLAMFPLFWASTAQLLTEIPFMFFYTGAALFFYFGIYRNSLFFYPGWIFFALSVLTRYTGLLSLPTIAIFLLILACLKDWERIRSLLSQECLLGALSAIVLTLPWFIREYQVFGDPFIGIKHAAVQVPATLYGHRPWYYYGVALPWMMSWILAALSLPGLAYAIVKKDRLGLLAIVASLVVLVWFSRYEHKAPRLISSVLPFLAILVALGVSRVLLPWTHNIFGRSAHMILAVVLALSFYLNYVQTQQIFRHTVTLGYPAFRDAMAFIETQTPDSAILIGPNVPQMYWYSKRQSLDYPAEEKDFVAVLARVDWTVVTNFERGQPRYVLGLLKRLRAKDVEDKNVLIFRDNRFVTILVKANFLRGRM